MEHNKHGFEFEDKLVDMFNIIKSPNYTGKYDAWIDVPVPVKIKCIKKGNSIMLSDYFNNLYEEKDFYLIIGFYENSLVKEVYKIFINVKKFVNLFIFYKHEELKTWIKSLTGDLFNTKISNEWKDFRDQYNAEKERIIKIAFKRDHKGQKRIQANMSNKGFKDFLNLFSFEKFDCNICLDSLECKV